MHVVRCIPPVGEGHRVGTCDRSLELLHPSCWGGGNACCAMHPSCRGRGIHYQLRQHLRLQGAAAALAFMAGQEGRSSSRSSSSSSNSRSGSGSTSPALQDPRVLRIQDARARRTVQRIRNARRTPEVVHSSDEEEPPHHNSPTTKSNNISPAFQIYFSCQETTLLSFASGNL